MSTKVLHRSLSSIHILYNQALVGGLSDSFDPATRIGNIQLNGGSTYVPCTRSRLSGCWQEQCARSGFDCSLCLRCTYVTNKLSSSSSGVCRNVYSQLHVYEILESGERTCSERSQNTFRGLVFGTLRLPGQLRSTACTSLSST